MMLLAAWLALAAGVTSEGSSATAPTNTVIVVVGEPGETQYAEMFTEWATRWKEAAQKSNSRVITIGPPEEESKEKSDHELLTIALAEVAADPPETLWLVFIGHGTFDGKKAKFNLRGKDITATELAEHLHPIPCRTAIINSASASGSFLAPLAGTKRVVVTSTQSGFEYNFARFGGYLSQTIGATSGDLDKDGQTSLLEAWLAAAKQTQEYYDTEGQLATEHSLLDDNGDGKGTPHDWFRGIHITKTSTDGSLPDGTFANQFVLVPGNASTVLSEEARKKRDILERQLAQLRQQKARLSEEEYLRQLQELLVPLAMLYESAEEQTPEEEPQPEAESEPASSEEPSTGEEASPDPDSSRDS